MAINPLSIIPLADKIIDGIKNYFPTAKERNEAKVATRNAIIDGNVKLLNTELSAIIAEAQSEDKWTSRARPSFLYVIYSFILAAPVLGILHAFSPETSVQIAMGARAWLNAMPEQLWYLFGTGYLGYTGAREYGKHSRNKVEAEKHRSAVAFGVPTLKETLPLPKQGPGGLYEGP